MVYLLLYDIDYLFYDQVLHFKEFLERKIIVLCIDDPEILFAYQLDRQAQVGAYVPETSFHKIIRLQLKIVGTALQVAYGLRRNNRKADKFRQVDDQVVHKPLYEQVIINDVRIIEW